MNAQNFNFALKFPQNGRFLAPNCCILEQNIPARRKFGDRLKFKGPGQGVAP